MAKHLHQHQLELLRGIVGSKHFCLGCMQSGNPSYWEIISNSLYCSSCASLVSDDPGFYYPSLYCFLCGLKTTDIWCGCEYSSDIRVDYYDVCNYVCIDKSVRIIMRTLRRYAMQKKAAR